MENFYPKQYLNDSSYEINHNYLKEQFSDVDVIFNEIKKVVKNSDYTLGSAVDELENLIAKEAMTKYGIGVGSGTDALFLSLKASHKEYIHSSSLPSLLILRIMFEYFIELILK